MRCDAARLAFAIGNLFFSFEYGQPFYMKQTVTAICIELTHERNRKQCGSYHHSHLAARLNNRTKFIKTNQNFITRRPTIRSVVCKYETRITNCECDLINIAHTTSWSLPEQWKNISNKSKQRITFSSSSHTFYSIGGTKYTRTTKVNTQ